jgi:hypothetical protein
LLKIKKESDRQSFIEALQNNFERRMLSQRIIEIKAAKIEHVIIPSDLGEAIYKRFIEKHKKLIPRHQRDISRLLAMVKANALLNFSHRERVESSIAATQEDVEAGFKLYGGISEANELGLSPEYYEIYVKLKHYIETTGIASEVGITINDYQGFYEESFHRKVNYDAARETLKTFVSMSLLKEDIDLDDRRTKRYLLFECVQKKEKSTQW